MTELKPGGSARPKRGRQLKAAPDEEGRPAPRAGKPLRLFYWNAPNFGDALSHDVVEHVSGRPVRHTGPRKFDLAAIGSLFTMIGNARREPRPGPAPLIWGSGCMRPPPPRVLAGLEVCAVRGPITAALLNLPMRTPMGDPGIFAAELIPDPPAQDDRIGIVPHHRLIDDPALALVIERNPVLKLIDVRTHDAKAVLREIAACRFVLSSSLHGLIVADAFGVPNTWLDPRGNHSHSELKFLDYALSVDRKLDLPVQLDEVEAFLRGPIPEQIGYANSVAASRERLRASFPERLRGRASAPVSSSAALA